MRWNPQNCLEVEAVKFSLGHPVLEHGINFYWNPSWLWSSNLSIFKLFLWQKELKTYFPPSDKIHCVLHILQIAYLHILHILQHQDPLRLAYLQILYIAYLHILHIAYLHILHIAYLHILQRQDPLCLPGRPQLPGHRVQVQGGRSLQRDGSQLLLPPGELQKCLTILLCSIFLIMESQEFRIWWSNHCQRKQNLWE